jgi:hypothetical protein
MAARTRRSSSRNAYDDMYDDQAYELGEVLPGERIGRPPARSARKIVLRGIFLLAAAGGVWAFMSGQVAWPAWLPTDISAILSSLERRPGPLAAPAPRAAEPLPRIESEEKLAAAEAPALPPRPAPSAKEPVAPSAEPKAAPAPLTTGALPPAARRSDDAPDGPLRPAIADPSDRYQVRAAAVGLHPELSRALLSRLSPADYRNAGIAIKNALEAPEAAVYVWPRQRKREEALFKVHFVPGAAAGCRRYVVSVTKDGWLTTAPPMEKCGSQPRQARRS